MPPLRHFDPRGHDVSRGTIAVRSDSTPPPVHPGDAVQVRDAYGNWLPATVRSEPRYDRPNALGRNVYLTVLVELAGGFTCNWPAEDVRTTPREDQT